MLMNPNPHSKGAQMLVHLLACYCSRIQRSLSKNMLQFVLKSNGSVYIYTYNPLTLAVVTLDFEYVNFYRHCNDWRPSLKT